MALGPWDDTNIMCGPAGTELSSSSSAQIYCRIVNNYFDRRSHTCQPREAIDWWWRRDQTTNDDISNSFKSLARTKELICLQIVCTAVTWGNINTVRLRLFTFYPVTAVHLLLNKAMGFYWFKPYICCFLKYIFSTSVCIFPLTFLIYRSEKC